MFLAALKVLGGGERPDDAALMAELARGEQTALECLYDRYGRAVFSLALRITQHSGAAEEIVQDVFLQLWKSAPLYQPERGRLEPWLFTIARNRALDHLRLKREKQRRIEDTLEIEPGAVAVPNPEAYVDLQRRSEKVRAVVNSLPAEERRAIELAFFEGMSHSEVAAALAKPLGTVKSWIRNGLIRLREALAAEEMHPRSLGEAP
ncbi:MAG: sigma-70 family RNA polymerase sigma factor [Acidobacteria bacterium]|nr:sigma-70 family RNA polymerase sigma factor [Acidobacteriota bacterium]